MNLRPIAAAAWLLTLTYGIVTAEPRPQDRLLDAMDQASQELSSGEDRQKILDRLKRAIGENSESKFLGKAKTLSVDLTDSIQTAAKAPEGKPLLMDTTLPIYLVTNTVNWKQIPKYLEGHPDDPWCSIVRQDRRAVETLLPLLRDRSPTRSSIEVQLGLGGLPKVPRVCDLALLTIERISQCRFHFNAFTQAMFHELSPEARDKTIARLETWWRDNRDKSLADGIRDQLPHAEFYETLEMANNLARLKDGAEENPDRDDAMDVMRRLARENWGSKAVRAADSLARLGDLSTVDEFYTRWPKQVRDPDTESTHIVRFLLAYGGRREWEFFHTLAAQEIQQGLEDGAAKIWPILALCERKHNTPLMIPGVALALTKTKREGAWHVRKVGSQRYSAADDAAECLQKLTGEDFGYRIDGTAVDRSAAIEKAQQWWETEGRQKYTFDYIETLLEKEESRSTYNDK